MIAVSKLLDLTHTLDDSVPTWSGSCGFHYEVKMDYDQGVRVLSYKMHAGVGTHMDAPTHFFREGKNIADIELDALLAPLCVINVSNKRSPELFIQPEDILEFEKEFGQIPSNGFVAGFTGWQEFWGDPLKYRNPDKEGKKRFPGFSKEAAELLMEREIAGIGIDTLSPDGSNDEDFPVHRIILGGGRYIVENLVNLDKAPPRGALAILLPLKIKAGTESAIRAVCVLP